MCIRDRFINRSREKAVIAGLGSDFDEKKAYRKGVFEYLERKIVMTVGVEFGFDSTNGVAAHRYKSLAANAAYNELCERDSFLRHWYLKAPFKEIVLNTRLGKAVAEDLRRDGFDLLLKETRLGFKKTRLAFLVNRSTGGFALGLSSGRGASGDVDKSILEAVINLYFGNEGRSESELIDDVKRHGLEVPRDHRAYWLLMNPIPNWILNLENPVIENLRSLEPPSITVVPLSSLPVPVVGVRSEQLNRLTFGFPSNQDLDVLIKNGYGAGSLFPLPHPIP